MSTIFPGSASVGQIFEGYSFNGVAWDLIGNEFNPTYFSPTAPDNPKAGDLWVDSSIDVPSISPETILTTTAAASTYQPLVSGVSNTEIGYLDGVTSSIQTQLNAKQEAVSGVSSTEIGYLDGVTSSIQTQLNSKAPIASPTFTGNVNAPTFRATNSSGAEGGEITFAPPATSTSISGGVTVDVQSNNFRIFETGGTNRGVNLDITALPAGTGSRIALAGVNGNPFRMASGVATAVSNGPVTVTFPASRFTVAPIIQVTGTTGWGWFSNLSSTSVVVYQTQSWGGSSQAGDIHWQAVQMTSGSASG